MSKPAQNTAPGQLVLDLGHEPSHAEADFLVTPSNRMAFERIIAFPEWPSAMTLLTGPAKSGKSHLARIWVERAGAVIAQPRALESLTGQGGTTPIVIEDVDRPGYDETALFNLLNQSMRDQRPILMTARLPVADWPYKTNDLLSRARLAASFRVETPDDIQLSQLFVKLFADRQVAVDPKIISFLVARMERSTEEVARLVEMMDEMALARRTGITRTIASEVLAMRAADLGADNSGQDPDERDE